MYHSLHLFSTRDLTFAKLLAAVKAKVI
uniref:Uncharacterized protein n=1 Tax=Arundo donax TaxID=35708 RepID=A0A0A8Y5C8_ARUDO